MSLDAAIFYPGALVEDEGKATGPERSSPALIPSVESSGGSNETLDATCKIRTDQELLLQVSSGDKEALTFLFRRHARSVFNVAHRILKDDGEAEDLTQELFLFIYQKASLFDADKSTPLSWIIQMTYHRAIDRRRYLNARGHYDVQQLVEERQEPVVRQTSIDQIAARSLLATLRDELAPEQLRTLELHFFEGYTFHEIAEKTGQTLGNVRNHHYRGLERLRSLVFAKKRD